MPSWINGNLVGTLSVGRGKSIEYMWRGTELGIRVEGEPEYKFVDLRPTGEAINGKEIELRVDSEYLQWRYVGEEEWKNLIAISDLKGDKGEQGIPGVNGNDGRDGENGKSLEFNWNDTSLGIRKEGDSDYQYVNLEGKQGIQGIAGADGRDGITPNIKIGNVVSVESSEPPSITIRGDKENPILDFNIPKGVQGTNGQDGTNGENGKSLQYNWNGTQLGVKREDENSYSYVDLRGKDGKDGKNGIDGTNGQDGADGVTPNITIGTVTTLEAGENATVTKRGTKEEPIFDFGIPRGNDGVGGTGGNITLVTTEIIDGTLTLTTDRYQTTTMKDNTTIVLPEVEELTEICLVFNTTSELTIIFPKIRWYKQPSIRKGKINKFTFTYINGEWLGEHFSYYNSTMMPIMDGLVCWLDGFDLPVTVNNRLTNGTVWENKVEGGEDAIIRTIVGNDVEGVENGYFRTNGNGYVILPSFMANNIDGTSIFVDAKINKKATTQYDKVFVLGYGTHFSQMFAMTHGTGEFGQVRSFEIMHNTGILGTASNATFPMTIKIGATTKKAKNYSNDSTLMYTSTAKYNQIFNNNFLNAETPTKLNTADVSYGLVLIYNRELTEEEMLHNYMYSLSIERGE